jgi:hypothetical protein
MRKGTSPRYVTRGEETEVEGERRRQEEASEVERSEKRTIKSQGEGKV